MGHFPHQRLDVNVVQLTLGDIDEGNDDAVDKVLDCAIGTYAH
jgi:hypothetical protein